MDKRKILIPIAAVVVIGLITGIYFSTRDGKGRAVLYNGVLEAVNIDVRAEVGGRVVAFPVAEGETVSPGKVICELDRKKLELQVRGYEGQLTAQKSKLEAMQAGLRSQELEQARLLLDQARVQREKAEKDYQRLESLYSQEAVSEFERDNAKAMYDLAADQESRADQAYQMAMEGARSEELKAQAAIVDATEAQLEYAKIQIEDAQVKSPVAGRLVERYLEAGELALPGGLVATVADYKRLKVKVYVPEDKVGAIKINQKAVVTVDSFPGKEFTGRVSHKSAEAEFTPKNVQTKEERVTLVFEVSVVIENPDEEAIAGLPADVRFLDEIMEPAPPPVVKPEAGTTAGPAPGSTAEPEAGSTAAPMEGTAAEPVEDSTAGPADGSTAAPAEGSTTAPAPAEGASTEPGATAE